MTPITALAFVALGFVGGAASVALIWKAMNHVACLTDYRNGFDDGRAQGLEDGGDLVFSQDLRTLPTRYQPSHAEKP